jgi:ubiquinone/menaquinone biosynthesis C-methylase UbiE
MAQRLCPWWIGYLLASPLRRLVQDPVKLLGPYVREGMTVIEPGPGMGFFTFEMARLTGPTGRVVVVDIQAKMLEVLKRRARKAGLIERIEARLVKADSLGLDDLAGVADFALVFAVVHEVPDEARFFSEIAAAMKPGACVLLAEPTGHVDAVKFDAELKLAAAAGLAIAGRPEIRRSLAALLRKG